MEWLTGVKPTIKRIRVFGSHCTYFDDPGNKLLPRGRSARFIGVESDTYYVLWDADAHKIVTRRHVMFRERGPSIPYGVDTEGGGETEPGDVEDGIGVPEEEASDLVDQFHDNEMPEEDVGEPTQTLTLGLGRVSDGILTHAMCIWSTFPPMTTSNCERSAGRVKSLRYPLNKRTYQKRNHLVDRSPVTTKMI